MTTNARKWQSKCNEIQKLLEDEIYLKDDLQGKIQVMEKRVKNDRYKIILCVRNNYLEFPPSWGN